MQKGDQSFLGTAKIGTLMRKFTIPSVIGMLVSALYNIVDQLFIGQVIGPEGNAATNIVFPLTTMCIALSLVFGIGGASSFNLAMGSGDSKRATGFVGSAVTMLFSCGFVLLVVAELFLQPILLLCGAEQGTVFDYANVYVRITAIGFPFLILSVGGGHLIRADGSPGMTMFCNALGAVINIILDALFVVVFRWGMEGAALATIIGQIASTGVVIWYLRRFKTVPLTLADLKPQWCSIKRIMMLGMASFFNQLAMMVVQVVLNQLLKKYGMLSEYGSTITLACAGIAMKVSQVFFSFIIGLSQGSQPIESYNYGAKKYDRVRGALRMALGLGAVLSIGAFLMFEVFPKQILSLFGDGGEAYMTFGERFFRIFLLMTALNFVQPIVSTFFTSIGKAYKGVFLSLTRQFLFLLPLLICLPMWFGIDGILYAGPISDGLSLIVTLVFMVMELRQMRRLEQENALEMAQA